MTVTAGVGTRRLPWLERLLDALIAPDRRERTAFALLAAYTVVWSLYGAIAKSSQSIHFDMGENIAWSRELSFGTPKHPPLPAWLVRVWFSVFPLQDWAYYLFAMVLAALALWAAWRISARYLDGEKRVVGLALLTLVPFFNFHALKLNSNAMMTSAWALATWAFLHSYQTRRPLHAVLAGIAAAAAALTKYWAIFLLIGLGVAVLADPRRRRYFRSPAPWLTIVTGMAVLAPHLVWLYLNHFTPFDYAMTSHAATLWDGLVSGLGYVAGALAYVAIPTVIAVIAARPGRSALADTVAPQDPDRRLILIAFIVPIVLPIAAAMAAREEVVSLWALGSVTLFPVVLLSSPQVTIARPQARHILALALAFPIVALALSPVIAVVIHRQGVSHHATQYQLVAQAMEKAWRETTDRPLRLIGSYHNLLDGSVFYFQDRPSTLEITDPALTPWADAARVVREGIALVCPSDERGCLRAMDELAARNAPGKRVEVEIARTYFGASDLPVRYIIVTIPPLG